MDTLIIDHKNILQKAVTILLLLLLVLCTIKITITLFETRYKSALEVAAWQAITLNMLHDIPREKRNSWNKLSMKTPQIFLQANTSDFGPARLITNELDSGKKILISMTEPK